MNTIRSAKIIRFGKPGPAEVLKPEQVILTEPSVQEVLIDQKAIGVNFLDVGQRNGQFPVPVFPSPIGLEAAGIIEAVGPGVTDFQVGDRVAYYALPGAYASKRIIETNELFKLPEKVSFEQAASVMIKGLTAQMLIKESYEVKAGDYVVIQAMTGGVGSLLSAWAKWLGANIIGVVGSYAKKQLALERGFEHVIDMRSEDITSRIATITNGRGADVVYDSIGKESFEKFLSAVRDGGTIVSYGAATGWPDVDREMIQKRNIHFVQAILNHYPGYQDKKGSALKEVFTLLQNGVFNFLRPTVYALDDAPIAHSDLESRKTMGSIILKP